MSKEEQVLPKNPTPIEKRLYGHIFRFLTKYNIQLHPNVFTLVNAVTFISSYLPLAYNDPGMNNGLQFDQNGVPAFNPAPVWAFVVLALGLVSYIILDCVDGAQARRLKLTSPLGQLLDHGLDSLSNLIQGYLLSHILAVTLSDLVGAKPYIYTLLLNILLLVFYMSIIVESLMNWDEHYSGTMTLSNDSMMIALGPVELQLAMLYFLIMRILFGMAAFSGKPLFYFCWVFENQYWQQICNNLLSKHLLFALVVVLVAVQVVENVQSAWDGVTKNTRGYNLKNRFEIFSDFTPFVLTIISHVMFMNCMLVYNSELYATRAVLIASYHGLSLSIVTVRIIVSTVLKVSYKNSGHTNWEAYLVSVVDIVYCVWRVLYTEVEPLATDRFIICAMFCIILSSYIASFVRLANQVNKIGTNTAKKARQ